MARYVVSPRVCVFAALLVVVSSSVLFTAMVWRSVLGYCSTSTPVSLVPVLDYLPSFSSSSFSFADDDEPVIGSPFDVVRFDSTFLASVPSLTIGGLSWFATIIFRGPSVYFCSHSLVAFCRAYSRTYLYPLLTRLATDHLRPFLPRESLLPHFFFFVSLFSIFAIAFKFWLYRVVVPSFDGAPLSTAERQPVLYLHKKQASAHIKLSMLLNSFRKVHLRSSSLFLFSLYHLCISMMPLTPSNPVKHRYLCFKPKIGITYCQDYSIPILHRFADSFSRSLIAIWRTPLIWYSVLGLVTTGILGYLVYWHFLIYLVVRAYFSRRAGRLLEAVPCVELEHTTVQDATDSSSLEIDDAYSDDEPLEAEAAEDTLPDDNDVALPSNLNTSLVLNTNDDSATELDAGYLTVTAPPPGQDTSNQEQLGVSDDVSSPANRSDTDDLVEASVLGLATDADASSHEQDGHSSEVADANSGLDSVEASTEAITSDSGLVALPDSANISPILETGDELVTDDGSQSDSADDLGMAQLADQDEVQNEQQPEVLTLSVDYLPPGHQIEDQDEAKAGSSSLVAVNDHEHDHEQCDVSPETDTEDLGDDSPEAITAEDAVPSDNNTDAVSDDTNTGLVLDTLADLVADTGDNTAEASVDCEQFEAPPSENLGDTSDDTEADLKSPQANATSSNDRSPGCAPDKETAIALSDDSNTELAVNTEDVTAGDTGNQRDTQDSVDHEHLEAPSLPAVDSSPGIQSDVGISSPLSTDSDVSEDEQPELSEPEASTPPPTLLTSHSLGDARKFSHRFPEGYQLEAGFLEHFELTPVELGVDKSGFRLKARCRQTGRWVSTKFFPPNAERSVWISHPAHGSLPYEAAISSELDHRNIVKPACAFKDEHGWAYVVEEIGICLTEFIASEEYGMRRVEMARHIFAQIVEAIHYLEQQGLSHNDLRPDNIIVTDSAEVKLARFHAAKLSISTNDLPISYPSHEYYGDELRAPPEVLPEVSKYYHPSHADIWGLGIILFELVLGYSPFSTRDQLLQLANGGHFPTYAWGPGDPELLDTVGVSPLLGECLLVANPEARIAIEDLKAHPWLQSANASSVEWPIVSSSTLQDVNSPSEDSDALTPTPSRVAYPALDSQCPEVLNVRRQFYEHFSEDINFNPDFLRAYQPGRMLGVGGFGCVIEARHRTEGHSVAVKFIRKRNVPPLGWTEDDEGERLPLEVKLMKMATHENIARSLDVFQDNDFIYIGVELHGSYWSSPSAPDDGGCSVHDYIDAHGPLSENVARHIFGQIVDGVHYLHSMGISHGDIKPANALIDSNLKVKLIDFGNAVLDDTSLSILDQLHPTEHYFGTEVFMPPECFTCEEVYYPPTDVWSLGILLIQMLTCSVPFLNRQGVIFMAWQFEGDWATELWDGLGDQVKNLIREGCLVKKVGSRATIGEVREHAWLSGWRGVGAMMKVIEKMKEE